MNKLNEEITILKLSIEKLQKKVDILEAQKSANENIANFTINLLQPIIDNAKLGIVPIEISYDTFDLMDAPFLENSFVPKYKIIKIKIPLKTTFAKMQKS